MGLTVEQVLSQLRVSTSVEPEGSRFKFKLVVTWPLKRFEQTLHGETEFDTEDAASAAADVAKDAILKAILQRYLPGKK